MRQRSPSVTGCRAAAKALNERQRRLWAAAEARSYGRGGIAAVARATGISEDTIGRGVRSLASGEALEEGGCVVAGAGRPAVDGVRSEADGGALSGWWIRRRVGIRARRCGGARRAAAKLASALVGAGHQVSDRSVGKLLQGLGFRLHANHKTREGTDHPDRDAQFRHINETAPRRLRRASR